MTWRNISCGRRVTHRKLPHAELGTLADNPQRWPLAPENGKVTREIRQLLFGKRPNIYRAVFTIDGDIVRVLRVRRASRRFLTKQELED